MADPPSSPASQDPNPQLMEPTQPSTLNNSTPATTLPPPPSQSPTHVASFPNPNPTSPLVLPPPPPVPSYALQPGAMVNAQSFRGLPQFTPVMNYQNPSVPPPGVNSVPSMVPGSMMYQVPPGQMPNIGMRTYAPMPNGYMATPQGNMPPAGVPRYPSPYPPMVRSVFHPRPPGAVSMIPTMVRPPIQGIPGIRPIISPIIRPVFPSVTPAEKPQTTVYVGKILPTVDNEFMLSLLRLCGPVKSWKRVQDPTDGTLKSFGFCEFESAEGVMRALRLLSKLNIDGQELVLNVDHATREYLKRYVEKKTENAKKQKEAQATEAGKERDSVLDAGKNEFPKSSIEEENNGGGKDNNNEVANSGIVTDEDKEADSDALEKLTSMIDERSKTRPPPPPPPPPPAHADSYGNGKNSELAAMQRDADVDFTRTAGNINDDETASRSKTSEQDKPETSSPDKGRRYERRSRGRDVERDIKREKEREIERYEREAERERVRKERDQRRKLEVAEREYEERLKDWEYREREKEKQRQHEKEREKDRERKRKKEILYDEDKDEDSKKRWRRSELEEKRRKRHLEKEEDLADRLKEQEEMVESKKRAEEEQQLQMQREALKILSGNLANGNEKHETVEEASFVDEHKSSDYQDETNQNHSGDSALLNSASEDLATSANAESERQNGVPARKLGFGLVGSGKRTAVLSVFHEEDDDDAHKDKKMRPLVPIDYSTEELQAVQLQSSTSGAQPANLVAAAEFAKRISHVGSKEEKPDTEKERIRRSHDRPGHRHKEWNDDVKQSKKDREAKTHDTKKLLDAKQLIDMIPKTKEELFAYDINWIVYDKHELHERMRPWISKKITEFLGEEEKTLVDYIVSSTSEHMKASQMLELLQTILDEEAEMFVLKMWRMLIFEIKKVELGLVPSWKSKS